MDNQQAEQRKEIPVNALRRLLQQHLDHQLVIRLAQVEVVLAERQPSPERLVQQAALKHQEAHNQQELQQLVLITLVDRLHLGQVELPEVVEMARLKWSIGYETICRRRK